MAATTLERGPEMEDLRGHLDRWVGASLITRAEADSIERFELAGAPTERDRAPLLTEALAYLGAALAAAAGAVLVGDRWGELSASVRVLVTGGVAAVTLVAGTLLRRSEEPAIVRLSSVLWLLAVAAFAWFAWVAGFDALGWSDRVAALVAGLGSLALATVLWAYRPAGPQLVAMLGAAIFCVLAAAWDETIGPWLAWGVALAWIGSSAAGRLVPKRAGLLAGSIAALFIPSTLSGTTEAGVWLGLATAVAIIAASVPLRQGAMLGLGVVALFLYLVGAIARTFGGTGAMPIALLVVGAAVLVLALSLARRSPFGRP